MSSLNCSPVKEIFGMPGTPSLIEQAVEFFFFSNIQPLVLCQFGVPCFQHTKKFISKERCDHLGVEIIKWVDII